MQPVDMCNLDRYLNILPPTPPSNLVLSSRNDEKMQISNLFNPSSASEAFDATYPTNVVVTSEGTCTYIPPGIFMSSCPIDITWFPFDDQNCDMKFGSWTYNGFKVVKFFTYYEARKQVR